jgi:hypothetical protein
VISSPGKIEMLDSVCFGEENESARGEYIICYPSKSDSIWSVAKKYGKTVNSLARQNKLKGIETPDSRATLDGVHFLIV